MCGISGILLSRDAKITVKEETLSKNNSCMAHRGPDSSGFWISEDKKIGLSQTRLSIVDLDERASQPMILDNGNIIMVFNGEIYNYKALHEKLKHKYSFKSTSDTEVLGYAYLEYGVKLFDLIEGMFAFAIYNKKKNEVLIARDVVGQKPMVYCTTKDGFYFASEIPVLLSQNIVPRDIDMSSLGVFMTDNFAHIPQPFTAFKDIKKLKPGYYVLVKNGKITKTAQYSRFKKTAQPKMDEFEFISKIADEMKPTDVTFSSFLSGGNDSSLVCAALRKNNKKKVEAYTLRLGKDDSDFARSKQVAKILNLNHHVVDFNASSFLTSVEEQVKKYGEPYFHLTSVYADYILRDVRKKHKVIFTGAGGDEVYYGYNNLNLLMVDRFLKTKKIVPKFMLKPVFGKKYEFLYGSTLKDVKVRYYMHNFALMSNIFKGKVNSRPYFEEINKDFFDFAEINSFIDLSYMSGLLTENSHSLTIQSDLAGMKNSVEIRCPFLERRIIQRGYSLKLRDKISLTNPKEGKVILKKALLKIFPKSFVYAKKIGFGVEISKTEAIIAHNEKKIISKITKLSKRKEFSEKGIMALVADKDAMHKNFTRIMKLYALEVWFEEFVDR
jgi:asparagine synthase (glutamine-hydrolysing)